MGMGPDSHYASIFPHNPINAEVYTTERLVLPVQPHTDGTEPKLPRITLSVPAINNSRRIVFYITGQAKLDALKAVDRGHRPLYLADRRVYRAMSDRRRIRLGS